VGADRVVALEGGSEVYSGGVDGLFADGELVRRLNLGLPVAAEVAQEMARRGRPLPALPLTLNALLASLGDRS
jgi:hypothetical protein